MLTKEDLLKLTKERLAELLLEEWNKTEHILEPSEFLLPNDGYNGGRDCFHGGPCTNPFHDCINCLRQYSNVGTISTDGTNLQPLNK